MRSDLHLYIVRSDGIEMLAEESSNSFAVLVWNQTHGNLCVSHRRKNCLGTLSGVASPDSVHVEAWTDTGALQSAVACFALNLLDIKEFLILFNVKWRS